MIQNKFKEIHNYVRGSKRPWMSSGEELAAGIIYAAYCEWESGFEKTYRVDMPEYNQPVYDVMVTNSEDVSDKRFLQYKGTESPLSTVVLTDMESRAPYAFLEIDKLYLAVYNMRIPTFKNRTSSIKGIVVDTVANHLDLEQKKYPDKVSFKYVEWALDEILRQLKRGEIIDDFRYNLKKEVMLKD